MTSKFCPECGGMGEIVKCSFVIPCDLCKANKIGDTNTKSYDYLENEDSPFYWIWLREMINSKQINPNGKSKRKRKKRSDK